jgi:hypothetical protein
LRCYSPTDLDRVLAQKLSYQAEPSDFQNQAWVARYLSVTSPKLRTWLGMVLAAKRDTAMTLNIFQAFTDTATGPTGHASSGHAVS